MDSEEKGYQDDKVYYTLENILSEIVTNLSIIIHLKGLEDEFKENIVNRSIFLISALNKTLCFKDKEMAKYHKKSKGDENEKKNN